MKIETYKNINKEIINKNPNVLFIIEDNDRNTYYDSICGSDKLDNLVSIKTKKGGTKKRGDLYNDKNFESNKYKILSNFLEIRYKLTKYNTISMKDSGYGFYLKSYAPKTYNHIVEYIKNNLYFNNDERVYQKRTPSYNEIIGSKKLDISNYNEIKTELIKNKKSTSITIKKNKFELGQIIIVKHTKTLEEIICKITIPCYDIKKISSDKFNLFEGYTKPDTGEFQFHVDYIGSIKSGTIEFADDYMNRTYSNNNPEEVVIENKKNTEPGIDVISEINKEIVEKEKNTELGIDAISEINKELVKQTKPLSLEVEEVVEILEKPNKKEVIENKKTYNTKSSNWFGVDDFKTNLDNFIKGICSDPNPSILDLKNSNYLIASDLYLQEINYFDGRFKIINKIKLIDYKLIDLFGAVNLFTKEEIYGQSRITRLIINDININIIDKFLKSKY